LLLAELQVLWGYLCGVWSPCHVMSPRIPTKPDSSEPETQLQWRTGMKTLANKAKPGKMQKECEGKHL